MFNIATLLARINFLSDNLANINERKERRGCFLKKLYFYAFIPILLMYSWWTVRTVKKLLPNMRHYDEKFKEIYDKIAFVRDCHIAMTGLLDNRLLRRFNEKILADYDDLAEDFLFASDEEFHRLVKDLADRI